MRLLQPGAADQRLHLREDFLRRDRHRRAAVLDVVAQLVGHRFIGLTGTTIASARRMA